MEPKQVEVILTMADENEAKKAFTVLRALITKPIEEVFEEFDGFIDFEKGEVNIPLDYYLQIRREKIGR